MAEGDIKIIMEVLGAEDVEKAGRVTTTLKNKIESLGKQLQKGVIDNKQYQQGVQQLIKKNAQAAGGYKALQKEVQSYAGRLQRQINETKKAEAAQELLNRETSQASVAIKQQNAAMAGLSSRSNKFSTDIKRSSVAMNQFGTLASDNTRQFKRFGAVGLQQVGYQVGDFAVQLQGGTNAAVAFGQQGSQLLGIFGPLGSILGAALAIVTAFVAPMLDMNKAGGEMAKEFSKISNSLEPIEPLLSSIRSAFSALKETGIDTVNLIANNLGRLVTIAATAAVLFAGKFAAGFIAARVATMSLAGALVFLRGALIRTGIGAIVVFAGELVFQFTKLVKGAGGFGEALKLLGDVASGVWTGITESAKAIPPALKSIWMSIQGSFFNLLSRLTEAWSRFLGGLGADLGGVSILGKNPFQGVADSLNEASGAAVTELSRYDAKAQSAIATSERLGKAASSIVTEGFSDAAKAVEALKKAIKDADSEAEKFDLRKILGQVQSAEGAESGAGGSGANGVVDELTKVEKQIQSVADTMKSAMSDAFMSMVEGTKSFKDSVKDMARAVIKQLFDILVVQRIVGSFDVASGTGSGIVGAIMGMFANGGAFNKGQQITAYANGGVVNQPTVFPMANGAGLMGEAGPEAIMPLKRGKNGKLGVQMEGNAGGNVTVQNHFHISANGDESVKRIIAQEAPKIANLTQKQILDQRRRGGVVKATFG
jgi:hypothetical protein